MPAKKRLEWTGKYRDQRAGKYRVVLSFAGWTLSYDGARVSRHSSKEQAKRKAATGARPIAKALKAAGARSKGSVARPIAKAPKETGEARPIAKALKAAGARSKGSDEARPIVKAPKQEKPATPEKTKGKGERRPRSVKPLVHPSPSHVDQSIDKRITEQTRHDVAASVARHAELKAGPETTHPPSSPSSPPLCEDGSASVISALAEAFSASPRQPLVLHCGDGESISSEPTHSTCDGNDGEATSSEPTHSTCDGNDGEAASSEPTHSTCDGNDGKAPSSEPTHPTSDDGVTIRDPAMIEGEPGYSAPVEIQNAPSSDIFSPVESVDAPVEGPALIAICNSAPAPDGLPSVIGPGTTVSEGHDTGVP